MKFFRQLSILPPNLSIETHNLCNRKCWFCKFGSEQQKAPTHWMSWGLINKIILNLKDFDFSGRLSWYRINEPLLDKRIFEIIALSRRELPHSFLSILTNGDLLTPDYLHRFFDAGINSVGVSIYDNATFQKFQAPTFERCVLIDRRPNKETSFVESRGGNISIKPSSTCSSKNCLRPSSMMNILSNGDVVLCCADFYSEVKMGSLLEQRIEEVWRGVSFEHYRQALRLEGRHRLRLCSQCTYHGGEHQRDYPETKRSLYSSNFKKENELC